MAPGGKIVNIASRAYLGAKNHPHYVASKAALVPAPRPWNWRRAAFWSARSRPAIDTPLLLQPVARAAGRATGAAAHGRAGQPQDIANAVSFLAAPHCFITGQVIFVDGGKSLGGSGSMSSMEGIKWDLEVDALVVGSGAAHAAALTAREEGLDVLLVEKTDRIGGSTAISGGALWIPLNAQSEGAGHPTPSNRSGPICSRPWAPRPPTR